MTTSAALAGRARPHVLAAFRIVVGFFFACHGAASLFGVFGGAVGAPGEAVPVGAWPSWYAAVIQFGGGLLVLLGLFTRAASLVASGSMAYAYFVVHQPSALLPLQNGGEPSALYCWAFLLLAVTGPGTFALDRMVARRTVRRSAVPPVPRAVPADGPDTEPSPA
ncbi:DoxX family protein [Kitasatospora sp. NPDC086801]|uniref:DoxX family protein n=1 Tax=Kitasatospora sp. NPDC086801 TaxID=3364066 RepID=UPI0037F1F9AF